MNRTRWERALSPPRVARWCLPVAFLLALLGLPGGFMMDDWFFVISTKLPDIEALRFQFRFASGDPGLTRKLMDFGLYFWWALPELELAFVRPLSAWLIQVDLRLFGTWSPGHHLHSAAWYVATVAAARAVYLRVLPWHRAEGGLAVGAVALALFTLDPNHVLPAIWLSNRNALVSAALALASFAVHLRSRGVHAGLRAGAPSALGERVLAPLLLVGALAGGETALGFLPYVVCWELVAGPGSLGRRLRALIPTALVATGYLLLRHQLGAGVHGSGIYLDPMDDPAAFLLAAPPRLAALLGGRLLLVAADLWLLAPALRPLQVGAGLLGLVVWFLLFRKVWADLPAEERGVVRWAAPAAVLALIPVLGTFPSGRLFLPSSLGAAALLAVLATAGWRRGCPEAKGLSPWCRTVGVLFYAGTALAPLIWAFTAAVTIGRDERMESAAMAAPIDPGGGPVVMVGGDDGMLAVYARWIRAGRDVPQPLLWWTLSSAPFPHRLTRLDERTLDVEVIGGAMLDAVYEQLVRDDAHPLKSGDTVALDGLDIAVLDAASGRPTRVRFRFGRSVSELQILALQDGSLVRVPAPGVGESVVVGD